MKSYWKSLLFILITFTTTIASAQENCSNGTDDDGDGLIDCFDGECSDDAACEDFFFGNTVICADEIDVTTFAIREQWGSEDESATSHVTPAIGDLDGNGIPEVISVNNYGTLDLFVLNGATGATIGSADIGFTPENAPIIAEIDGDEVGDIIVSQNKGDDLALYNVDMGTGILTERWRERASVNQSIGLPGVADFDENGTVEIYYRNEVMDALTGTVIVAGDGDWALDYTHGSIAVDVLPDGACADCAGLELISGNEVWAINEAAGTRTLIEDMDDDIHDDIDPTLNYYPKYYPNWNDQWSTVSAADYNLDGNIDLIMTGALGTVDETYNGETTIFFWDVANQNVITYHDPTNNFVRGPGRVNIGDVDGDGQLNANFVMDQKLYSLDENFNIHWIHPIKEGSSGFTGCSLFDFDGDGAVEVVYRSEESLLIIDGVGNGDNTTNERNEIACVSRTQEEYPVIADVDGDGSSEICVSCYTNNNTPFAPYSNTQFSQLRVYESDGEAWMPARGVWNQHGYYNVNINDDLTIPAEVQDHSVVFSSAGSCEYSDGSTIPFDNRPLNTFLNQAPILNEEGCVEFASPDIDFVGIVSATDADCPDAEITVVFELTNIGDIPISGSLPVSYYFNDPRTSDGILLDTEVTLLEGFEVNETIEIEQTINGVGGDFTLFVVINDNGGTPPLTVPLPTSTVPECDTENNIQSVDVGFKTFELQHEVLFENRKCVDSYVDGTGTTINVPDNGEARVYYFGPTPGTNETIYLENFEDRENGDQSDTEETSWTSDPGTESPSFYGVATYNGSKMFNGNNTGGSFDAGVVTWTSEAIDISDFTNVNTRMDIFENGNQEGSGEWRDFVRISYELRDTLNQVTETGLFSNGFIVNDFDYQQAFLTNVNAAGGRLDSLLTITVEIHNTSSSEFHYIDNISVDGTGPDIEGEFTEADGFEFYWFDTADTDFSDTLNSTSTYSQMADGTYNVVGYFQTTECFSDTVEVEILRATPTVHVWAYEINPLTQCDVPDGSIGAFVYTQTKLGTFPANATDNQPQDTLLVADGYEFNWRDNDDITNTYFATGNVIDNLLAREFAVDVIDLQTRCTNTALVEVSTDTETIQAPNIVVTHITSCGGTGELAADIAGNTADFTFDWYDGNGLKPAPDFTGAVYTVPTDGEYTLVVTSNSSGCQSDPVTRSVDDNSIAPDPSATLVQNNTSCVAGNGIVSADGDGAGNVSGFTFEWFLGANTLASNALPGTAAPGAFLVNDNPYELGGLEEGTYTVRVTETSTNCFKTETVDVSDTPGTLAVTPGNLIQTNINSCDVAALGSIDASGVVATSVTAVSIGNLNSSFEELDIISNNDHIQSFDGGNIKTYQQEFINGWSTTAGDQRIEIWHNNNTESGSIHDAFHGDQFAEINANETAALYFDLATVPGSLFNWSFAHKGRAGTDEISVNIGAAGAEVIQNTFSTGNTAWAFYEGLYTVPTDQFTTRFQFEAVSTAGGNNSVGNFVDTVSFVLFPYRFELYEGATVSGAADFINTSGIFNDLNDGDYVLVVYDNLTGCGAVEIPITITRAQDQPIIATSVTDDDNCDNDAGSIGVTTSMPGSEPSSYTYEIFDGHSFSSQIGSDETVTDGATPFTFTNLAPGDYRIRITNDDTQCTSFTDEVVDDITVIPAFSTSQTINDNTSCDPVAPNGFLSVSIQGDSESNYSFSWWIGTDTSVPADFGPTVGGNTFNGNSLSDLAAGDYTVIAENISTGCETIPLTLPVDDDPFIPTITLLEVTPDTSCGEGNGELRAFATFDPDLICSECVTNYTFEWFYNGIAITTSGQNIGNNSNPTFSGTNGSTISGLSGDLNNYSVTLSHNRLGCDATESIILSENEITPILSLSSTQANTICDPSGYDGEISVNLEFNSSNVSNPSSNGFTFRWFDASSNLISDGAPVSGSTTESIAGLGAGTYKVVAESGLECVSDTLFVNLGEALVLPTATEDATGTNDNTVCDPSLTSPSVTNNGQITVTVGTGTAADYTFTWYNGTSTAAVDILNDDANDGGGGTSAIAGTDTTWTGTSIILSNIPGGTYTLELNSTITGCSDTFEFDIIDDASTTTFQAATPTATPTPVTFCGTDNGAISTSVAVGSGSYTFRYYAGNSVNLGSELTDGGSIAGATTNNITGLATGNYTVTVVDNATGCVSAPASAFVDNTPILPTVTEDATGTNDNTVCDPSLTSPSATFDGQITVTVGTGTAADYTFTWYNGTSTAAVDILNDDANDGGGGTSAIAGTDTTWTGTSIILSNIPGGTYTLELNSTITGCSDTFEFDIIDDASTTTFQAATPTATPTPVTFCGTDNGAISTSVAVGSGSYTFRYYAGNSVNLGSELTDGGSIAGATTNNITGLATGNYTVTVVDNATGCVSAPASAFVDNTPILPTVTEDATGTNDNTVCDPSLTSPSATFDGQITVTVGTGTAADYTFTWYNGTSTAAVDILNDDANDGGGGTSAIAGTDTTWTGTSIILSNIPGGTYTLELNSTITGCSDTFEFDIIDDASTTTFQAATPTATPTPVTFCGTDNGAISTSVAVGSGSYTFRYYAGNSVNLGSELTDGGSIAGATTNNITGLATGNYTVTVVDNATGCVSAPASAFVDNTPILPTATEDATGTNDNTVCDPSLTSPSVTNNGQITVTVGTGTAADYTFTWYNGTSTAAVDILNDDANDGGGGTSAIAGTDTTWTGTSIILSNIPGGTYTLELNSTITGCSDTFEFDIIDDASTTTFQAATPTATPTPVTFCGTDNGAISTSVAVGSGSYTFRYYAGNSVNLGSELTDGGSIAGATTNNITGLATGNYTVTVVDNATGCVSAPASAFVDNTPILPTATEDATGTNDNTVCDPSLTSPSVTNNGQITVTVGAGTAADYTFTWYNGTSTAAVDILNDDANDGGGGTSAIAGTDTTWTGTSIILSNIPGGTYTLELNSTITGCSDTFEFDIIDDASTTTFQAATPTATPTPVTFCGTDNGAISTSVAVGSGSYTFRYYAGNSVNLGSELTDGGSIAGATTNNITGLATGNYTVTVVDNATGCVSAPASAFVDNTPILPTATEDATGTNDNTVCDPSLTSPSVTNNGQITVTVGAGTAADYTFTWYNGTSTAAVDILNDDANDGGGGTSAIAGTDTTWTGTSIILSNIPGGTYTLELNSTITGCSDTFEFDIIDATVNPTFTNPAVDIVTGAQTVCGNGTDAYPDGSITITEANIVGSGSYSYRYYFGGLVDENNRIDNASDIFTQKGTTAAGPAQNVSGSSTNAISGLDAGTYTVVVLDLGSGCTSTEEVVTINSAPSTPPLVVDTEGANSICDFATIGDYNGFIRLRTTDGSNLSAYTYQWFLGQSTSAANSITGSQIPTADISTDGQLNEIPSGTYTVLITDPATGCTLTIEETIVDDFTDVPVVAANTINNLDVCEGNAAYPNGGVSITSVTGGSGNYSFEWYFGSTVNPANLLDNMDDIFAQKGIAGTAAVNVSNSTTASISGLNPGNYTVRILDTDRGCYSASATFTVGEDPNGLSLGAFTNVVDNYSCNLAAPSGSATANGSGATTPRYEWYAGTSTTGGVLATTQTANGLSGGIYTVKFIDDATNCFITSQVEIFDFDVTLTPTTSNVTQTNCTPNGEVSVDNVTFGFTSADAGAPASPRGYTGSAGTLTYQWYFGPGISIQINDGDDIGNGSNPLNAASSNMIQLTAGTYTVVVTDTESGCTSATATEVVADGISINTPDLDFNPILIPNACADVGSFEVRMLTNPSGHDFTFEFYEGAQDYANLNSLGDGLATNDQLASNPGQNITVNTVTESIFNGAFNNSLIDVVSGTYTVVVEDQTTGCRYQEFYNFPFLNQQTTTTITVENVDECPDNGVARVGLQEDGANGFIDGEVDDISEYVLFLYAGTGIPADRESAYTFEGIRFPLKYDAANGQILNGDDAVYTNAGEPTPVLNLDDNAEFHGLPAGPYIAVAREIPNPAFNNTSTAECWSEASFDQEIIDLAYEPLIDDVDLTPNSVCDEGTFGGNGQISVTVAEDPSENANAPEFQQPAGYAYSLRNSGGTQIDTLTATGNESEIFTTTGLDPDDYSVRVWRIFETFDIGFTPGIGTFIDGETIDFSGGDVGVITTGGVGAGTLNVYITTGGTPAATETITGRGSSATGTITSNVAGTVATNGCSVQEIHTIADDPASHTIVNAATVDFNNCDAVPASTITINDNDIEVDGAGQLASNYTYQWFKGTTSNNITGTVGAISSIDLSASGLTPIADTYFVVATSTVDGCVTPPFEVTINDNTVDIQVMVSVNTVDNSCVATNDDGSGVIDFSITSPTTGTYSFAWYTNAGLTVPVAGTATGISGTVSGPYTGQLSGVNGGQNYYLEIIDTQDPNDACTSVSTIFLDEVISPVELLTTDYNTQEDNSCATDNGFIEISSVNGIALTSGPANYTFRWYETSVAPGNEITGSAINANTGEGNRIEDLSTNTYFIEVTEVSTSCVTVTEVEIFIDEIIANPTIVLASPIINNTFCVASGTGDGAIDIDVTFAGLSPANTDNFDFVWYRGDATNVGVAAQEISPTPGANAGTATLSAGEDLINLVADTYTVVVTDNTDPYNACESIAEFIISDDLPVFEIRLADITTTPDNNCGTANPNGTIDIAEIFVDGVAVDLATNGADYRFDWVGLNAGSTQVDNLSDNDEVTGVAPGTYTVSVTKLSTNQCSSATVSVTVEEQTVNPTIELVSLTDNTFCIASGTGDGAIDIDVTFAGLSPANTDNFDFVWYRGDATNVGVAAQEISPTPGANAGTATLSAGEDLINLVADTYTVVVTDNTDPYNACESIAEFIISDDLPVFEIRLADITTTPDNNCGTANPNGTIDIAEIFVDGVAVDLATNGADYRFDWVGLNAGSTQVDNLSDNDEVTGVAPGTYTVSVTKLSTNQCSSATVSVTVEEQIVNPTIELVSLTDNTFCIASGTGDGAIDIDVTFAGLSPANTDNFDFVWYRGDATNVGVAAQEISPTPGANAGTATLSAGEDLINLVADTYTVVVTDNTDPYNACESIAEFIISDDLPVFEIRLADITTTPDNNCGTANPNGTIDIAEIFVDGVAVDLATNGADYRFDWVGLNAGSTQVDNLSDNDEVTGVAPGTYTVSVTKLSTNQCSSATVSVTVEEQIVNPTIELVSLTDNTFCIASGTGDGAIDIDVTFAGLSPANTDNFDFVWYRGDATNVGVAAQEISPTPGANAGTATLSAGEDLINLVADTYTVVVTDNTDPYNACESIAEFIISDDLPVFEIRLADITTTPDNNCGTANPNGTIDIAEIFVDGVAVDLATNGADYRFDWVGLNAGSTQVDNLSDNDEVTGVAPGTYTVSVTKLSTNQCSSATVSVTVEEQTVNPTIELVSLTDNTFCVASGTGDGAIDIDVTFAGLSPANTDNFDFVWYRGDATNVGVAAQEISPTPGANAGTATLSAGEDLINLVADTYTVVVTDNTDPYNACESIAEFIISDDLPVFEIRLADITTTPDNNCGTANPNGTIDIAEIFVDGVAVDLATNGADYRFDWVGLNAGSTQVDNLSDNDEVTGVAPGTYTVSVTKLSTNQCSSATVSVTVEEQTVNPTIELVSLTDNTFCIASGTGDGAIDIDVTFAGLSPANTDNFDFVWYRGDATNVGVAAQEISPTPGANAGTATLSAGEDLINLVADTYTVVVTDNTDPYNACESIAEFIISDDLPVFEIRLADITTTPDNNCGTANPNGTIDIAEIFVDGVAVDLATNGADYRFDWVGLNVGSTQVDNLSDNDEVTGVAPGTYTVSVTKLSTNQCSSATVSVTVEEQTVNPTIEVISSTASTFCSPATSGDGTIIIDVTFAGLSPANTDDFDYVWYRGDVSSVGVATQEIYPTPGANAGTAAINGVNEQNLINLAADNYTVVVSDNADPYNSCESIATFSIDANVVTPTIDEVAIQARTAPDTLCTGNSGTLIIQDSDVSTGSLSDFEIQILQGSATGAPLAGSPFINPATPISFTNLAADDYYIIAENSTTGCIAATAIVNVKDSVRNPLVTLISMTPDEDCGAGVNAGGLEVLVNGQYDHTNQAFLTFLWEVAGGGAVGVTDNESSLTGVAAGDYQVTVRNILTDCSITRTYTITNVPITPSISDFSLTENNICDDDGNGVPVDVGAFELLETTFDGNTLNQAAMAGLYRLEVYDNLTDATAGNSGAQIADGDGDNTNFIHTSLSASTYYAIVRKLDSDCFSEPLEFDIVDNVTRPLITISLQEADSTCAAGGTANGTLRATATVGATTGIDDTDPDYAFEWFTGSGAIPANSLGVTTSTISGLSAGTYTVEVERLSTGCISIEEFELPNIPTNVEIMTVDVVDATNCTPGNGSITVTSVNRNAVTDYDFDYYDTDPTIGSPTPVFTGNAGAAYTSAVAGVYYIIGTNTIVNCTTPVFEIEVSENLTYPAITLDSFDFQSNCDPGNPNGRLLVLADGQPENATYDFEWFFGVGTGDPLTSDDYTGGANLTGESTNEVSGLAAGFSYTVQVTNNTTGCISTETFEMTEDIPNPIAISTSTSANTNCVNPNGIAAVSVISPAPGRSITDYTYYWFTGDLASVGANPNPANADYTGTLIEGLVDGQYVVYVIDQIDNFCQSEAVEVTIENGTENPTFELTTNDVTVCFDEKDGFAIVSVEDLSTVNIEWFDDSNNPLGNASFLGSLDAGMYRLVLTHAITGCVSEEVFEILNNAVIPSDPFVLVNNGRNNCQFANGSAIANVDGATNNFLFEWFDPNDMVNPYATGSEVFNLDTTTYLVRATNLATGCESAFTSVEIGYEVVDPVFDVIIDQSTCLRTEDGSTNQFTGSAIITFEEFQLGSEYQWFNSQGDLVGSDSRLIDAPPGDYSVTFTAGNGCSYTANFTINTTIEVYNGVSANNDGKNDFFLIDCIDFFAKQNVQIFNRDGVKVYEVDNYNNTSVRFEGISNVGGTLTLPAGTYYYVIDIGEENLIQGFLELVR